jgi:6,7-dimethyl-8-ribityllumazine synthase
MAAELKNLSEHNPTLVPNAAHLSFGVVVSDYNPNITHALLDACYETLVQYGASPKQVYIWHVPGAFELPLAAKMLYQATHPDAVICLGCVIKGDTEHDKYINYAVSRAIMQLNMKTGTPFIFGVLTPNTLEQAQDRAGGKHGNKGTEAAIAAIQMAALNEHAQQIKQQEHEQLKAQLVASLSE